MPAKVKVGIVALCDAVYKDEGSNKVIIAGLYSGDIITEGTPHDMRFALYAEVFPPDTLKHVMDIQFWFGGKQLGGVKAEITSPVVGQSTALMLQQFPLVGDLPAKLELKMVWDGGRPVTILSKQVSLRSAPTASPPPRARSPRAARAKASKS